MDPLKIVAISDLHGRLPILPACDIVVIAGDFCMDFTNPFDPNLMKMRQMEWLDDQFRRWEANLDAEHILITPGNHDWITELPSGLRSRLLIDEGFEYRMRTFWFSPWTSLFLDWNYMLDRKVRQERFALIPHNLDVLVCHSPAHKIGDESYYGEHLGCPELRQVIAKQIPSHFCYGHIHEGQRKGRDEKYVATKCHNCAMFGQKWTPVTFTI